MEITEQLMLKSLVSIIKGLGYSSAEAEDWAILIGDTPVIDGNSLVVIDEDRVVTRLPLSAFPDFQ